MVSVSPYLTNIDIANRAPQRLGAKAITSFDTTVDVGVRVPNYRFVIMEKLEKTRKGIGRGNQDDICPRLLYRSHFAVRWEL